MKQIFMNKLRIFLISAGILLTGYAVVKACGGGDWDDNDSSNFAPETFVTDEAYTPFFFDSYYHYYGDNYDNQNELFTTQNIQDWSSFLGKNFDSKALNFLLNKASYNTVLNLNDFYTGKKELSDSLKLYAGNFNKSDKQQLAFVQYLTIAKGCEPFATSNDGNDWDYNSDKRKAPQAVKNITAQTIETLMQQTSNTFVKERYWFQLVRYNFFFDLPAAITAFDKYKNSFDKNVMYYRTMAYTAGAYYKQKNYSIANYYYSLVFASNDDMKCLAHWSFHPQEEKDWQQTLALCKDNNERITLWQMIGIFYSDETRSIDEILKINPTSTTVDLLLTRTVNEVESSYTPYEDSSRNLSKTFNWCKNITDNGKISNLFLWQISTGYLAFLKEDYTTSEQYYALAAKHTPNTILAKDQLRLLQLLTKVGALKTIRNSDEQSLLADFNWIYSPSLIKTDSALRTSRAQNWIKQTFAKKYQQQGDLVKSECFVSNVNFYSMDKNVNDLKAFLIKTNPSAFELLCREFSAKKEDDLWEFQAIQSTFKDDLDNAVLLMTKASANGQTVLPGNPFNGKIQDCHDCDHAQKQKVKYTKLAFLQKMKELKDNVVAKNDVYNNALLLANGYYNITHFGNARVFYEGAVLGEGHSDPYAIDSIFKPMLTNNTLATKYYKLALQSAIDDEQKAKCLYMVAKCERNEWYNKTFFNNQENDPAYDNKSNIDFITWNSFKALKQYSHTQYYKDVIQECGYFKTAMAKH